MPRLAAEMRERAVGMLMAGMSQEQVARTVGTTSRTIRRLTQRLRETGKTADTPRSGRPRVTTPAQDRRMVTSHLRDRFMAATVTARMTPGQHNERISAQTVRNRLRAEGLRARRPFVGPVLTRQHKQARLAWSQEHLRWTRQQWKNVLFTDESRFALTTGDGRIRVYRRRNERYAEACTLQRDSYGGGGSIMVWGGISHDHRTPLVVIEGGLNATRYRDEVLTPQVLPFRDRHPGMILQQDNATCHTARLTRNFLQTNDIQVMPWPAKSPDLNPIEHAWDILDRRVRSRPHQPQTLQELRQAILEEWDRIPQQQLTNLVKSMRRRCSAAINARGGNTGY